MNHPVIRHLYPALLFLATIGLQGALADPADAVMAVLRDMDSEKTTNATFLVDEKSSESERRYRVTIGDAPDARVEDLVSVGGKPPSAEELAAFAKERAEQHEQEKAAEAARKAEAGEEEDTTITVDGLSSMITPGTLKLKGTTDALQTFSFKPQLDIDGDVDIPDGTLIGTLVFDPATNRLRQITIENTKPFKPDFKVKIKRFAMSLHFDYVPALDKTLPVQIENHMEGRAMMVVSINEHYSATFSGYEKVATEL